jgi:hypothetical protein
MNGFELCNETRKIDGKVKVALLQRLRYKKEEDLKDVTHRIKPVIILKLIRFFWYSPNWRSFSHQEIHINRIV